jgi:hypothetical protein
MKRILKGLFLIGMITVMAGVLIVPAMAAEILLNGSFTLNNDAPHVTSVVLYNMSETDTVSNMIPLIEYAVKIEASDTNTLNDIDTIMVVINNQTYNGVDSVVSQATYKYDRDLIPNWSIVGPSSTTWSINVASSKVPGVLTQMSGTWWLHFTPGKIAKEDMWNITVTATDYASAANTTSQTERHMLWYGELTAIDTSFGFGTVNLGESDNPIKNPTDNKTDVTTIANGNYKLQSKSANWVGQTSGENAILDWDGELESGHFQLENDNLNSVNTTNNVDDSYTTITDCASLPASTAEIGDSKGVYAWISLAVDGFIPQAYQGTFKVQIATD